MSTRYVKVDEVETVESSNSTALIVFVVSLLAIAVIAMAMWQPWATTPPSSSPTTIIHESQKAPDNRPIIVSPPATQPADTNITIHNDVPKTQEPPKTDTNTDTSGNTTGDTSTSDN